MGRWSKVLRPGRVLTEPFIAALPSRAAMDRVALGRSGLKVSRIGLGMWQAGGMHWGKDVYERDCIAAMIRAHECGVDLIDTAEVYGEGHSEEPVGRAIKATARAKV